jgi:copper chaperone CopZ
MIKNTFINKIFCGIIFFMTFHNSYGQVDSLSIWVGGDCTQCKERIEDVARNTIGVNNASYDLRSHQLSITYQGFLFVQAELHRSLIAKGHDTEEMQATSDAYELNISNCNYRNTLDNIPVEEKKTVEIWVAGICGMCTDRIESAAIELPGVEEAKYDVENNLLNVTVSTGFLEDELHQKVAYVGHDTKKYKAPDQVYHQLPLCCLYREEEAHLHLTGKVYTEEFGEKEPLVGANVYWADQSESTITDDKGAFFLEMSGTKIPLVISFVGYKNDTLIISNSGMVEISLNPALYMDAVEIKGRKRSSEVSYLAPYKVLNVGKKELTKAACCSLAESFQTTPAVDESFSDAVTGTKTIQMLGLASPYIQITRENIPDIRGLSSIYGFEFTPGPWIEGINLTQGTGSVISGYEGITGQINVELFKPSSEEKMYFNAYANEGGRYEANLTYNTEVSENVGTAFLLHGSTRTRTFDRNEDGFLDMPLSDQFVAVNRWKFYNVNGWTGQAGIKYTSSNSEAGQISFYNQDDDNAWTSNIQTDRIEIWGKIGSIFNENRSSIGLQLSGMNHDLDTKFGNRNYEGDQFFLYSNLIFQTLIGNTGSDLKLGATYTLDDFEEKFRGELYDRRELVPGVFGEITYKNEEKISIVGGLRYDHHNLYGGFFTPRGFIRYAPTDKTVFRVVAGRGQRTASVFAENIGAMASNRSFQILSGENTQNLPYGLNPEVAWNLGLNYQQDFNLAGKRGSLGIDYFRTEFQDQVVVDYDEAFNQLNVYNLNGKSTSNSIQFLAELEPVEKLNFRLAYRLNDVQTTYLSGERKNPLIARHRGFVNVAYETISGFKFDYTYNIIGSKRIPGTANIEEGNSPSYSLSNFQFSKVWNNRYEWYVGAENLFNFRQENPIIGADNPYGDAFDASLVWGPIFGRNIYTGIRYKIFNEE